MGGDDAGSGLQIGRDDFECGLVDDEVVKESGAGARAGKLRSDAGVAWLEAGDGDAGKAGFVGFRLRTR